MPPREKRRNNRVTVFPLRSVYHATAFPTAKCRLARSGGWGGARIEGVEWDDCYKLLSDQTRNWTTVLRERTEGTIKPLQRNGSAFESSPPAITSVHAKTRVGEGAFTVLGIILGRPIASYNI